MMPAKRTSLPICVARFMAVCTLVVCVLPAGAQSAPYKFDLGVELGMSGYIGDANSSNIFRKPGFDGELSFRYIGDTRWAVRGVFSTFSLNGDTSGMDDVLPGIVNPETGVTEPAFYSFGSQVYDLSVRGEFNFFAYGSRDIQAPAPLVALSYRGRGCIACHYRRQNIRRTRNSDGFRREI